MLDSSQAFQPKSDPSYDDVPPSQGQYGGQIAWNRKNCTGPLDTSFFIGAQQLSLSAQQEVLLSRSIRVDDSIISEVKTGVKGLFSKCTDNLGAAEYPLWLLIQPVILSAFYKHSYDQHALKPPSSNQDGYLSLEGLELMTVNEFYGFGKHIVIEMLQKRQTKAKKGDKKKNGGKGKMDIVHLDEVIEEQKTELDEPTPKTSHLKKHWQCCNCSKKNKMTDTECQGKDCIPQHSFKHPEGTHCEIVWVRR